MEKIIITIKKGDLDNLRGLIEEHGVCNENKNDCVIENKPLQEAVSQGRFNMVKFLVEKGAHVMGTETGALRCMFFEHTDVTYEMWKEYKEILEFLLPFYIDDVYTSPPQALEHVLFNAIRSQSVIAVQLVLQMFHNKKWFPEQRLFHYAVYIGNIVILEVLISNGFKVDADSLQNACGKSLDLPPDDFRLVIYLLNKGGCKYLLKHGFLQSLECQAKERGLNHIADGLKKLEKEVDFVSIVKEDFTCIDF